MIWRQGNLLILNINTFIKWLSDKLFHGKVLLSHGEVNLHETIHVYMIMDCS